MVHNSQKWSKMFLNGLIGSDKVIFFLNSLRWSKMVLNSSSSSTYISLKLYISGAMEPEFEVWLTFCCVRTTCLCLINVPTSTCFSVLLSSFCLQSVSNAGPYKRQVRKCSIASLACSNKPQKIVFVIPGFPLFDVQSFRSNTENCFK